jgi:hypothetical protein
MRCQGVSIGIALQRRLGTGLFGGEGIYHAKIRKVMVWHSCMQVGHVFSRTLAPGEILEG